MSMTVLSVFDGLGGARIALDRLGIQCVYFASEIDKYAMFIANKNYPDIVQLGSVDCIDGTDYTGIDLLIGGSPCQGFSKAGRGENFLHPGSGLLFDFVRLLEECKPRYFLLENVKMKLEWRDAISDLVGVDPILINSNLVTAQNRARYYWTNIPGVTQPEDRNIYLSDIIESGTTHKENVKNTLKKNKTNLVFVSGLESGRRLYDGKSLSRNFREGYRVYSDTGKAATLTSRSKGGPGGYTGLYKIRDKAYTTDIDGGIRKLTPRECERLQGLPDDYTEGVSNTQRYKMVGNGFTIPVIQHILSFMEV
jgi:site-specific DNA-cytosine methylase